MLKLINVQAPGTHVVAICANGKTIKKVSGLADINGLGPNDSGMGVPGLYLGNGGFGLSAAGHGR